MFRAVNLLWQPAGSVKGDIHASTCFGKEAQAADICLLLQARCQGLPSKKKACLTVAAQRNFCLQSDRTLATAADLHRFVCA